MTSVRSRSSRPTLPGHVSNRDLFLGVVGIILLLAVSGALTFWNTRRLDTDAAWVAHTNQMRTLTADILLSLVDAETGERGFVITGKQEFLEPYEAAVARLKGQFATLKYETRDNETQQARIRRLEEASAGILTRLERVIALRRKSAEQAHALIATGEGKGRMDAVRALVRKMDDAEAALLLDRAARSARSYRVAVGTGISTDLLILAMVGIFVVLLRRNLRLRSAAAAALHMERERLRVTLASIGDAVIATDPQGRVTFLNEVAEGLTGWSAGDAHGVPLPEVFAIVNETTRKAVENPALRALAQGIIVGLANHTVLIARDGTERPIDDSAAPIRDSEARIAGAVLVFRDITERKRDEERLARLLAIESDRSRRLRELAQASLTLNAATTSSSVFGVVEAEARRIIGADRSDIRTGADPAPPPQGALTAPLVGRSGRPIGHIHLIGKSSGGFTKDDESILVQLAHMASVALENARLYEELREGDRRKDEFLATLAHELRNPLAPIRNSLQVMRLAGADRSVIDDSRAMIERQVQQMVRLVDDLLDVSRISRGKMELRRGRVELSAVIAGAVETSRPLIERMGHALAVTLPPGPVHLHADLTRLAQVFLNLLNNAAKYSEPGGRITLTAECEGEAVVVRVRDTGIGIPADMLPRVFEIFTQVDRSLDRSQGGLGIGLTLVKRLTEMHGGEIVARSDGPGQGSEFAVRLPVLPDAGDGGGAATAAEKVVAPPCRRILVVDDNRDSADSLTMILGMLGNEVRTAYDGVEAVEAAGAFRPELVFLDIGLPRLNGYDAARRIRQLPGCADVVLVALTGWGQEADRRRSREAGFDLHLVKPVDPQALDRLLGEAKAGRKG